MGNEHLAEATAVILGAYLPYLWHDSLPTGTDAARAAAVADLWQALRPLLTHDPGVKELFVLATDAASGSNLVALRDEIGHQMNLDPALASEIGTILDGQAFRLMAIEASGHSPPEDLETAAERLRKTITTDSLASQKSTAASPVMAPATQGIPCCQVCKRQDETLRIVAFPYVVSLLVVTFRRRFVGLWCSRHAIQYQLMASAITAGLGWLGIPFGLVYTPIALFNLARGGNQPVLENQRMLFQLARHKDKAGDTAGAIRCLEAALHYGPEPTLERELRALYDRSTGGRESRRLPQALLFAGTVLAAGVIGLAIGIIDNLIARLLELVLGEQGGLFAVVLSWIPLVVMVFAAGLLIAQVVSLVVSRAPTRSGLLVTIYAITLALSTYYYVLVGAVVSSLLFEGYLVSLFGTGIGSIVQALAWAVTQGGAVLLASNIQEGINLIGMVLLMAATVIFGALSIGSGLRAVDWQRRLEAVRGPSAARTSRTSSAGWLGILLPGLAFAGALALSFLLSGGFFTISPEMEALIDEGFTQLESGDWAGAQASFEEAAAADPDSPLPYFGLMGWSMSIGDCRGSVTYAQQTIERLPPAEAASIYELLGSAYRCSDQPEEALAAYEQILALDPAYPPERVHVDRGLALLDTADYEAAAEAFEQAVEADPEWAMPYALLAMTYHSLGYSHGEAEAIQTALELPLETSNSFMAIGWYYYSCHNFAEAASYTQTGMELSPYSLDWAMSLGYSQVYLGEYESALAAVDRALEANPAWADPYVLLSAVYFEQGDLAQARQASEQAVAADPASPVAHSYLSYVAYFAGDAATALEEANQALEITPYYATPHQVLALIHLDQAEYEAAVESAEQALAMNPTDDVSHYVMGKALLATGQEEQAITEMETFLNLTWDRARIRDFREEVEALLEADGT